jgi:hypothetical protein
MAVYEINSLKIEKGTDFDETFKIYNEDGSPLDINSSFTGVAKIRKHPTSPTSYPLDLLLDEDTNDVNVSMAATMTTNLPSGRCYFDIILTYGYADTTTKKFVKGTIIVEDTASL